MRNQQEKALKEDVIILQGNNFVVTTGRAADRIHYETQVYPQGGLSRMYYRVHNEAQDPLTAHRSLVEDINSGRYHIAEGRFIRTVEEG